MMPVRRNQDWLPSVFNDLFGDEWPLARKQQAAPAVNIIENERDYRIEVAAPGMTREDFCVKVENDNELVIALEKRTEHDVGTPDRRTEKLEKETENAEGEQKSGQKDEQKGSQTSEQARSQKGEQKGEQRGEQKMQSTYLRREFSYTSFRQSFILPDEVDMTRISASMKHGVLTVELPKKEEVYRAPETRQIEIR